MYIGAEAGKVRGEAPYKQTCICCRHVKGFSKHELYGESIQVNIGLMLLQEPGPGHDAVGSSMSRNHGQHAEERTRRDFDLFCVLAFCQRLLDPNLRKLDPLPRCPASYCRMLHLRPSRQVSLVKYFLTLSSRLFSDPLENRVYTFQA